MYSQSRSAMGYVEGVTVEYGEGFTAGTERRGSGSTGRLAEHTAGFGGQEEQMRWNGPSGDACLLHLSHTIFGNLKV